MARIFLLLELLHLGSGCLCLISRFDGRESRWGYACAFLCRLVDEQAVTSAKEQYQDHSPGARKRRRAEDVLSAKGGCTHSSFCYAACPCVHVNSALSSCI
eukprot:6214714-Pleurochrysis_carterae.AAC.2